MTVKYITTCSRSTILSWIGLTCLAVFFFASSLALGRRGLAVVAVAVAVAVAAVAVPS